VLDDVERFSFAHYTLYSCSDVLGGGFLFMLLTQALAVDH